MYNLQRQHLLGVLSFSKFLLKLFTFNQGVCVCKGQVLITGGGGGGGQSVSHIQRIYTDIQYRSSGAISRSQPLRVLRVLASPVFAVRRSATPALPLSIPAFSRSEHRGGVRISGALRGRHGVRRVGLPGDERGRWGLPLLPFEGRAAPVPLASSTTSTAPAFKVRGLPEKSSVFGFQVQGGDLL